MNLFLGILRKIALGGMVVLILSIVLKGALPTGYLGVFLILSPVLYLLFVFFTWLSAKHFSERLSEELDIAIPENGYFVTLIRGIFIDITSPVWVIIDLFRDKSYKVASFVTTYIIVAAYAAIYFFIL